jgi:hypothetical protein
VPTLTCTGTISGTAAPGVVNGGIRVPAGYSTLNVNNITANITPNTGVDGIYFHRVGAGANIVIDSDTTPKAIVVNGASADGIDAQSQAAITIDHAGDIDASAGRDAIFAQVLSGGTALSITTAGELMGASIGIEARNSGTGALSVVVNGDVAGGTGAGIYARNVSTSTGDLSITTGTGTSVTGGQTGILARNFGSHALKIVTNGDVVGTSTIGIFARNGTTVSPGGTYLSVTTGAGAVSGGLIGIETFNYGSGGLTITTTGGVTAAAANPSSVGIFARNGYGAVHPGCDLLVSTGPGAVSGAYDGIEASNFGSQALKITTTGDVTGTDRAGIYALNGNDAVHPGTYLSITTVPGTISGAIRGIDARNYGSGALTITTNGDVTGTGPTSTGIYARAVNGISIVVNKGAVSGVAAGVQIVDGTINSLKNYGTVESSAGPSGTAIIAGIGNETVDNFGTITGSVDLGAGANAFTNHAGALFNSGPVVNVGVGNLFANDGTIDPGDPGNVLTTSLTGNFVQSSSGIFVVDVNGAAADRIDIAGMATLAGLVKPNVASVGSTKQWTILTATGGVTNSGITVMDTPTIDFDLTFPTANEMDLVIAGVNFLLAGQNRNEQAIAKNLNQIFAAGVPPSMQALFNALALLPTADAVANSSRRKSISIARSQSSMRNSISPAPS